MSRPSNTIRPAAGLVYPVRASTIEVLPAPLGPISPKMVPSVICRSTSETATTPP